MEAMSPQSDWEKKEKLRSILPQVQDLLYDLEQKGYPEDTLEIAEELIESVAFFDASRAKSNVKKIEDLSDEELEEEHFRSIKDRIKEKDNVKK